MKSIRAIHYFILLLFGCCSLPAFAQQPKPAYEFAQELPKPIIDLQKFVSKHVEYPDSAYENGIQGMVIVKAVVLANGNIDSTTISIGKGLKNGGAGLNAEALRRETGKCMDLNSVQICHGCPKA